MGASPSDDNFLEAYTLRTYKKRDVIIFQAEAPRYAYVIKSGMVKAYNLTINGDEKPVAFYKEGDFFPSSWIFSQVASATFFYEAFTKQASVYCVERKDFIKHLKSDPELLYEALVRQAAEELSMTMHINGLQQSRASDKIIYILHFLATTSGTVPSGRTLELDIKLTHQDLANLTGLTRETTAVELNKLKKLGLIDYGPGKPYSIDLNKLTTLTNDRYLQELTMPKV
ncbi:MAG TPA: Crp/Fnr family transcriptional regulator [Candidatus Saccharimonadales bacterium]|jgi:CRP/FNR family transcriptional regulator